MSAAEQGPAPEDLLRVVLAHRAALSAPTAALRAALELGDATIYEDYQHQPWSVANARTPHDGRVRVEVYGPEEISGGFIGALVACGAWSLLRWRSGNAVLVLRNDLRVEAGVWSKIDELLALPPETRTGPGDAPNDPMSAEIESLIEEWLGLRGRREAGARSLVLEIGILRALGAAGGAALSGRYEVLPWTGYCYSAPAFVRVYGTNGSTSSFHGNLVHCGRWSVLVDEDRRTVDVLRNELRVEKHDEARIAALVTAAGGRPAAGAAPREEADRG